MVAANRVATTLKVAVGADTWKITATRIRSWIGFGWVDGEYRPVIDRTKIPKALKTIAKRSSGRSATPRSCATSAAGSSASMADRAGRELDVDATRRTDRRGARGPDRRARRPAPVKLPS